MELPRDPITTDGLKTKRGKWFFYVLYDILYSKLLISSLHHIWKKCLYITQKNFHGYGSIAAYIRQRPHKPGQGINNQGKLKFIEDPLRANTHDYWKFHRKLRVFPEAKKLNIDAPETKNAQDVLQLIFLDELLSLEKKNLLSKKWKQSPLKKQ